jgi:hypothetical protein
MIVLDGKYMVRMMRVLIVVCVRGYREKDVRDGNGDCVNDGSSSLLGKARGIRDGVADASRDAHDVWPFF